MIPPEQMPEDLEEFDDICDDIVILVKQSILDEMEALMARLPDGSYHTTAQAWKLLVASLQKDIE